MSVQMSDAVSEAGAGTAGAAQPQDSQTVVVASGSVMEQGGSSASSGGANLLGSALLPGYFAGGKKPEVSDLKAALEARTGKP